MLAMLSVRKLATLVAHESTTPEDRRVAKNVVSGPSGA
jgi:hypothetical protein